MTPAAARRFLAVLAVLVSIPAHAQLFRAYLSVNGDDANPCTRPQPCRLLPAALAAVADGGEVWMLDSANYNTEMVTIARSVTILAVPGVVGSVVSVANTNAVEITAGSVVLRNLVITRKQGTIGVSGVVLLGATSLLVDRCVFADLPQQGLYVQNAAKVRIIDSLFHANGTGVRALNGSVSGTDITTLDIARSTFEGNTTMAIAVVANNANPVTGSVRDSRVVQNAGGIDVFSSSVSTATFSIADSVVSNNGSIGVRANGTGAKLWLTGDTISGNAQGVVAAAGIVESAGNNAVRNNGTDIVGTMTAPGTT